VVIISKKKCLDLIANISNGTATNVKYLRFGLEKLIKNFDKLITFYLTTLIVGFRECNQLYFIALIQ
jgi:hypothetical protein